VEGRDVKAPMSRILNDRWDKILENPCDECGRDGCWVKVQWKKEEKATGLCKGWVPKGCMAIERSRVRRGRRGLPYWSKGERKEA